MSQAAGLLIGRMEAAAEDIVLAARQLAPWQHQGVDELWPAHQQVAHLLAVETENFQPRIRRILGEDNPALVSWDTTAFDARYRPEGELADLAGTFARERRATAALFRAARGSDWQRTATWPDGVVIDLAWLAEKVLWHSIDHLAVLLDLHGEFAPRQG